MMGMLKRMFAPRMIVITQADVRPADRDPELEAQIDAAQTSLVLAVKRAERRSWEIRQELAGNVLKLVSGD